MYQYLESKYGIISLFLKVGKKDYTKKNILIFD